jgi:hypothetical protein
MMTAIVCIGDDVTIERELLLPDGSLVFAATLETVRDLMAQGHAISVDAKRRVHVDPPVHADVMEFLQLGPSELAACVAFWTTSDGPTQ